MGKYFCGLRLDNINIITTYRGLLILVLVAVASIIYLNIFWNINTKNLVWTKLHTLIDNNTISDIINVSINDSNETLQIFPFSKYDTMTNKEIFEYELLPKEIRTKQKLHYKKISNIECINFLDSHGMVGQFSMIHLSSNATKYEHDDYNGFILVYHQKTGSTFWHSMLKEIELILGTNIYTQYNKNSKFFYKYNKEKYIEMFCNEREKNKFPLITIIRDPMTRLLSGFLDKCTSLHANFHRRTDNAHGPCKKYIFNRTGINVDIGILPNQSLSLATNNITFQSFVKWLHDVHDNILQNHVDSHFKNYRLTHNLEYFHSIFNIFNMNDQLIWYWMARMIIDSNFNSKNKTYLNEWNKVYKDKFFRGFRPKSTKSRSNNKIKEYFNSNDIIYLALKWTFKDYLVFDIVLPEWICNHINHNNTKLKQFVLNKFADKLYLIPPRCIIKK